MTDTSDDTGLSRRSALKIGLVGAAAVAALSPFEALGTRAGAGTLLGRGGKGDYGPLMPVRDQATGLELLNLPEGFEYVSYGWTGDRMTDGKPTPSNHDGMAAFRGRGNLVNLVRNHEIDGMGTPFTSPAYDSQAGGGTTNLSFDPRRGKWLGSYASLSGTIRNCAGGPTPWGSWITCEEITTVSDNGVRHGYIFDVPADGMGDPTPLKDAGRFSHEAVAIDPRSGVLYLTEDAGSSVANGLYRYLAPRRRPDGSIGLNLRIDLDLFGGGIDLGRKERTFAPGGVLQMLRIGTGGSVDTKADGTGTEYRSISWVTIDNPDYAPGELRPAEQGVAKGAASFRKLEGAWFGNDRLYFISSTGGPVGQGQVFEYDPKRERLRILFASLAANVLNAPDNVTVSPRGGLVLCEDGDGDEFLHGLSTDGEIFPFALGRVNVPAGGAPGKSVAAGNYFSSEWAGACFDPSGQWLFANLQDPGITFAITGPWRKGAL